MSDDSPGATTPTTPPTSATKRNAVWITLIIVLGVIVIAGLIIWAVVANGSGAPSPTPPATSTMPSTPTPSPTQVPTPTPTQGTDDGNATRCLSDELAITLGAPESGAGSTTLPLLFENTGGRDCLLEGFPGVSLVGDGNGTQIGGAADRDENVPIVQNILKPGGSVQAIITITDAANVDCTVTPTDGFRVYPPHAYNALFVPTTAYPGCAEQTPVILTTQPVLPTD